MLSHTISKVRSLLSVYLTHLSLILVFALLSANTFAQEKQRTEEEKEEETMVKPAPDRKPGEGEGPFDRLVIRGAIVIDGTGAPPRSPMDIVIENDKIVEVKSVGAPKLEIDESKRPKKGTKEIDAHGKYVMPGIIDLHVHTGGVPKAPEAEYVYKLWLAHGITTVRGVPCGPLEWSVSEAKRSAKNEIVAPRIINFHRL